MSRVSSIVLNRLVVIKAGREAFNEKFHTGINIIRGENSSGKSSIMRFIFYSIGGDLKEWTPEMLSCDFTISEVKINGTKVVLKREIDDASKRPMLIYFGSFEEASKSSNSGWKKYPYSISDKKRSFSQVLFEMLDYPEMRTDASTNITMHQLLRLMYVDQLSPSDNLLLSEDFDYPLTRKTIGEFLFGVYENELYQLELDRKRLSKEQQKINNQIKSLRSIAEDTGIKIEIKEIDSQIERINTLLIRIENARAKNLDLSVPNDEIIDRVHQFYKDEYGGERELVLESTMDLLEPSSYKVNVKERVTRDATRAINTIVKSARELRSIKYALKDLYSIEDALDYDIADSELFITNLEKKITQLTQSQVINNELSEVDFDFCPNCLSELDSEKEDSTCKLCKKEVKGTAEKYASVKQEVQNQLDESRYLLEERRKRARGIRNNILNLESRLEMFQSRIDRYQNVIRSTRDEVAEELFKQEGALENEKKNLLRLREVSFKLNDLIEDRDELRSIISKIDDRLTILSDRVNQNVKAVNNLIFDYLSKILRSDLEREREFNNPISMEINFYKNTFSLNEKNQFSASSINILKKSMFTSIFYSSLDLEMMRYPRFLLIDNIEDKGMESIRTHNFQKVLVDTYEENESEGQLIFTTSDLHPELEEEKYLIGDNYSHSNKTLSL